MRYAVPVWSIDEIAQTAAEGLARADDALRAEHAVRGLDTFEETALHLILTEALGSAGLGVLREWPFPTASKRKPKSSERERCDLVLLPEAGLSLLDPVRRAMEAEAVEGTLFAPAADRLLAEAGIEPNEAMWIEVKATGQFVTREGVPGPNTRYTTELVRLPASDMRKLARERAIAHAAVMLVLFAQDETTARHDLGAAIHQWLDADAPIRSPVMHIVPITERIGNTVAAVCVVPVRMSVEL